MTKPLLLTTIEENKKIISTYSAKCARKDKHKREKKLAKAKALMEQPSKLYAKATKHYLYKKKGRGGSEEYEINQTKIEKDEQFDGILAITTNEVEMEEIEVLNQYKQLFKIEYSFRRVKSLLEVKPMFHWNRARINGHICCVLWLWQCCETYNFDCKKPRRISQKIAL